jgi:hypothetical protein
MPRRTACRRAVRCINSALPPTATCLGSGSTPAGQRFAQVLPLCPHPSPLRKSSSLRTARNGAQARRARATTFFRDKADATMHAHCTSARRTPIKGNGFVRSLRNRGRDSRSIDRNGTSRRAVIHRLPACPGVFPIELEQHLTLRSAEGASRRVGTCIVPIAHASRRRCAAPQHEVLGFRFRVERTDPRDPARLPSSSTRNATASRDAPVHRQNAPRLPPLRIPSGSVSIFPHK